MLTRPIVISMEHIVQRYCQLVLQNPEDVNKFKQFITWVKEEYKPINFNRPGD